MTRRRTVRLAAVVAATIVASSPFLVSPPSALAFNPIKPICTVAGLVNGIAQKACSVVSQVTGTAASSATTALTVAAVVTWAVGGARFLLHQTSYVLAKTTAPQLTSTWFSSTYWRVAGLAAVLTLPFLFAAAVQALLRSDLSLLIRSALGYLPLALLSVAIAAPLTMLLLAASDQLSAIVSSAAGNQSAHFLDRSAGLMGSISAFVSSSFVGFLVALFTAAGALVLWMELLVREAAVYVIVLMLPLAFAAFVWPARRIWAIRSIELLIALILSKFAIVAVLSLGGAALAQSANRSVTGLLAGAVLMALAAFAPWAMLRVVPLTELASAASTTLHGGAGAAFQGLQRSDAWTSEGDHWASKTAQMRRTAETSKPASSPDSPSSPDGATATDGATTANGATAAGEGLDAAASGDPVNANAGAYNPSSPDPPPATAASGVSAIQRAGDSAGTAETANPAELPSDASAPGSPRREAAPPETGDRSATGDPPELDLDRVLTDDPAGLEHYNFARDVDRSVQAGSAAELVDPTPPPQGDPTPPPEPDPTPPPQPDRTPDPTPPPQPNATPAPEPDPTPPPQPDRTPDPTPPPQPEAEARA